MDVIGIPYKVKLRDFEFGSTLYKIKIKGKTYYNYSELAEGKPDSVEISNEPEGTTEAGVIHANAAYDPNYNNNEFSSTDKSAGDATVIQNIFPHQMDNGSLKKYDPKTKKVQILNENQSSDGDDPDRKNSEIVKPAGS